MDYTVLFCLLPAFTFTIQESVRLEVSPRVTAECGKPVSLHCNTSSPQHGLSVKRMEWSQGNMSLCSVDSQETMTTLQRHFQSDFRCQFKDGRLSLVFQTVLPLESGNLKRYMCKLHSNKGVAHNYTRVQLQECCGTVDTVLKRDGPSCTFNHVYPDGDVHWFHGSRNVSDGSVTQHTAKSVDNHGWMIIHSWLTFNGTQEKGSHKPYNCSLKGSTSGKYIASTFVLKHGHQASIGATGYSISDGNRVRQQKAVKIALAILVSLIIMLK
ncbi:hypothetical protein ILYODFUR_017984 [Ilyodon furcidens]|uniref:Ig-like domain-containing protein n=1 Tax=Ilyodon furcidens TaxID=33524 RepID=A0ABV0TLH4_9TELE